MRTQITFVVPRGLTPEYIAQTFTAYLIGNLAFHNEECQHGPYGAPGDSGAWQLDATNDFWLRFEDVQATLSCRYPGKQAAIIEAAFALFDARFHR